MLAVVRLPFEGDITVGVAFHEQPHDPFDKVAEGRIPHTAVLSFARYGLLRGYGCFRQRAILFAGEYYPE